MLQKKLASFGERERSALIDVLSCKEEQLHEALGNITRAALDEYLEMLLGKQVPTKAAEVQERRLFHLVKNFFVDRIPRESEVSSMFQLTESASRTLIKNTCTKFNFDLETEIRNTALALLRQAEPDEEYYIVAVQSEYLLEELKRTVATLAPQYNQISKVKNSANVHRIPIDTYELLCNHYGMDRGAIDAAATREI